jgi:hypothetical protein
MIVAPSLEIVVTPLSSCTSLSRPRGPCGSRERDVRGTIAADGGRHLRWRAISQRGGGGGGRASVVRMESTTAMHALMFEMSCPFPWDVSVPSRRSTI